MVEVAKTIVDRHGSQLTMEAQLASTGRKPLDAWQAVIDTLHLEGCTAQDLYNESEPLLRERQAPSLLLGFLKTDCCVWSPTSRVVHAKWQINSKQAQALVTLHSALTV